LRSVLTDARMASPTALSEPVRSRKGITATAVDAAEAGSARRKGSAKSRNGRTISGRHSTPPGRLQGIAAARDCSWAGVCLGRAAQPASARPPLAVPVVQLHLEPGQGVLPTGGAWALVGLPGAGARASRAQRVPPDDGPGGQPAAWRPRWAGEPLAGSAGGIRLFALDTLGASLHRLATDHLRLKEEAAVLLEALLLRGELARAEAPLVTGLRHRAARNVLGELVSAGLVGLETPKGPVSLRFPETARDVLFPRLFLLEA
jgi:hypothetical protein